MLKKNLASGFNELFRNIYNFQITLVVHVEDKRSTEEMLHLFIRFIDMLILCRWKSLLLNK